MSMTQKKYLLDASTTAIWLEWDVTAAIRGFANNRVAFHTMSITIAGLSKTLPESGFEPLQDRARWVTERNFCWQLVGRYLNVCVVTSVDKGIDSHHVRWKWHDF